MNRNVNIPLCYCSLPMFLDGDQWLCPARFDGAHDSARSRAESEKQRALSTTRAAAGSLGGRARAETLTPAQTQHQAQQAARARWNARRASTTRKEP